MKESNQENKHVPYTVLSLSLDPKLEDEGSEVRKRMELYGDITETYTVVFPSRRKFSFSLSPNVSFHGVSGGNKFFKIWNMYLTSSTLLKHDLYNVITVQDTYFLALLTYILSRKHKIAFEIQVHGFEKLSYLRKTVSRFVLRKADAIRAVSQRLKTQLINDFKVDGEKITVVPILYRSLSSKIGSIDMKDVKSFVFLTVGRLVPVKNIFLQISALATVLKVHKNTLLWIVGEGKDKKKLKAYAKKFGVENNVFFWGWQNDMGKFYRNADVFLLTSDSEGWSLVVVEACASGLPVIMTDVGCAGEFIRNNENGIVIPPRSKRDLESAMLLLLENPAVKKRIGENALMSLASLLSEEETYRLYQESWGKALSR